MGVNRPSSLHHSAPTSALAGICKELIGSSVAQLLECHGTEKSMADRLASDLLAVRAALESISDLYEVLGEDSHENCEQDITAVQSLYDKSPSYFQKR